VQGPIVELGEKTHKTQYSKRVIVISYRV